MRKLQSDLQTKVFPNDNGDTTLMETHDQPTGSTTGEFVARRKPIDLPPDAPPERVRSTLRAEVENSLRDVCANWPTGEFDRIVADVTNTAMKYQGIERRSQNRSATTSAVNFIPGATAVVTVVMSATHSVQKFLQLETLPFR